MARPGFVALGVALVAMVLGTATTEMFLEATADPATQAYGQTLGFALTTPAGLVLLAYVADEFDFGGYFGDRRIGAMFGDFLLSVLGGGAVGLLATGVMLGITGVGTIQYIVTGLFTFAGAFGVFRFQTRSYFQVGAQAAD